MKHTSVFYALPVKILTAILCFACLIGCVFCILRSAWMATVGIFDDPPSCRVQVSDFGKLYYPSLYDGMELGRDYFGGDELAFLLTNTLVNETVTGTRQDGFCIVPEYGGNDFTTFLTYHQLKESNLAVRILLEDENGSPYVFFSNMEDITETDMTNVSKGSFTVWKRENPGDFYDGNYVFAGYDEYGKEIWEPVRYTQVEKGSFLYGMRKGFPYEDETSRYYRAWERDSRNVTFWLGSAFALGALGVGLLLLMLCQAGVRRGEDAVRLSFYDRLPAELAAGIHVTLFVFAALTLIELAEWDTEDLIGTLFGYQAMTPTRGLVLLCGIGLIAVMLLLILHFLVCVVRRIRAGGCWKNTVTFRLLRFLGHCAVTLFVFLSAVCSHMRLLWKWLLFCAVFGLWTMLVIVVHDAGLTVFWTLTGLAVCAFGALCLMGMDRVCRGAEIIASGKLDHTVDKKRLFGIPYRLAETLDHIRDAMQTAVSEQMRSERFRTELITNVSHDLKTPLTSIINYTDLLSKEAEKDEPDRETEREYIDVLSRQSDRLRRLTSDLLEASKASTGSLPVTLAPMDAGELLTQAVGEYESRLSAAGLTPVLQIPDTGITVRADGKHLWRVFDNLLSNICKYSLSGTRVYLTAETDGGNVRFVFRNISASPLNISPEELTERFVRGDESRHTEGSGLGLAIAHSLMALQGGKLTLSVDGDLFKASAELPRFNG